MLCVESVLRWIVRKMYLSCLCFSLCQSARVLSKRLCVCMCVCMRRVVISFMMSNVLPLLPRGSVSQGHVRHCWRGGAWAKHPRTQGADEGMRGGWCVSVCVCVCVCVCERVCVCVGRVYGLVLQCM